jgi:hypothetical protein
VAAACVRLLSSEHCVMAHQPAGVAAVAERRDWACCFGAPSTQLLLLLRKPHAAIHLRKGFRK